MKNLQIHVFPLGFNSFQGSIQNVIYDSGRTFSIFFTALCTAVFLDCRINNKPDGTVLNKEAMSQKLVYAVLCPEKLICIALLYLSFFWLWSLLRTLPVQCMPLLHKMYTYLLQVISAFFPQETRQPYSALNSL